MGWRCNRGPRVTLDKCSFQQLRNNVEIRKRLQPGHEFGHEFQGVGESDQDCCLLRCTVSLQGPPGMRTIKDNATLRLDKSCGYQHASRELSTVPAVLYHIQHGWVFSRAPSGRGFRGSERGRGKGRGLQFDHTNTTGSHISGHHDGALARLEFVQDPVTLALLLVTVDGYKKKVSTRRT